MTKSISFVHYIHFHLRSEVLHYLYLVIFEFQPNKWIQLVSFFV